MYYHFAALSSIVSEYVTASITPSSVCRYLVGSSRWKEMSAVYRSCSEFVLKHASTVMSTKEFVTDMTGEELEKLLGTSQSIEYTLCSALTRVESSFVVFCCVSANDKLSSISEASLFERVVKWGKAQLTPPATDTKDGKPDPRLRQLLAPLLKHIRCVATAPTPSLPSLFWSVHACD